MCLATGHFARTTLKKMSTVRAAENQLESQSPVNRRPLMVEKLGRVTDNPQRPTNLFRLLVRLKRIKRRLLVILTKTQQHAIAFSRYRILVRCCHSSSVRLTSQAHQDHRNLL